MVISGALKTPFLKIPEIIASLILPAPINVIFILLLQINPFRYAPTCCPLQSPLQDHVTFPLKALARACPPLAPTGRATLVTHENAPAFSLDLLKRAEKELGVSLPISEQARPMLISMADGDGRALINLVEQIASWQLDGELTLDDLQKRLTRRASKYDKSGEEHYNLISALHKSVRGSDPDAAIYWLARMFEGGEDPRYLARRLVRMAIEDIGLADPDAQAHCLSSWQTFERLGSPEGELALAQAVVYLALAPKSNSAYVGYIDATKSARESGSLPPPKHILNAPTDLMKNEGYGKDYAYDHDFPEGISGQNYFPEAMNPEVFYRPVNRGFEKKLGEYSKYLKSIRAQRKT